MDISALINLAVVGSDPGRVEVSVIDPIDIPDSVALGIAGIVSELVENATKYSTEAERARVSASSEPSGYVLQITDRGLGVADDVLGRLNTVLESQDDSGRSLPSSGLPLVGTLAARYDVNVRLYHGSPGLTARVTIPHSVIEGTHTDLPLDEKEELVEASSRADPVTSPTLPGLDGNGYGPASERSDEEKMETEAFLESVFAPLKDGAVSTEPPSAGEKVAVASKALIAEADSEEGITASRLATRVPGESFDEDAGDVSHTAAGEGAVEIKSALSNFDRGRRSASGQPDDSNEGNATGA